MKAHPGSAVFHVRLKRSALCGVFGTRIPKNHHLVPREKVRVQVLPVGCGVKPKIVLRRHLRKPSLGLMDEADVRRILLGGEKRDHAELRLAATDAQARTATDERRNTECSARRHLSFASVR